VIYIFIHALKQHYSHCKRALYITDKEPYSNAQETGTRRSAAAGRRHVNYYTLKNIYADAPKELCGHSKRALCIHEKDQYTRTMGREQAERSSRRTFVN